MRGMAVLTWVKAACEYAGGQRDDPPAGCPVGVRSLWWGLWWGLLACLVYAFCGQSSKFIYIDF